LTLREPLCYTARKRSGLLKEVRRMPQDITQLLTSLGNLLIAIGIMVLLVRLGSYLEGM
jgi:hypothetical protein